MFVFLLEAASHQSLLELTYQHQSVITLILLRMITFVHNSIEWVGFLRGMDTLSGEATLSKFFLLPAEKWSTLRVDLFLKGIWCVEAHTGSNKSCLPWQK